MRKKNHLKSYKRQINELRLRGKQWGLTTEEINFAFEESFSYMRDKYPKLYSKRNENGMFTSRLNIKFWKIAIFLIFTILMGYGISYHKPTHNFVERNIQEVIYPFMKVYRRLTLPLVVSYPSLSGI